MNQWNDDSVNQWLSKTVVEWTNAPMNDWLSESMHQWISESMNHWFRFSQLYIYTHIFPDLHDQHDPSWCWEYLYICMWQLWWTRVADFAAVLAVKPCVLCPFIGWSLGILIISYTAIVPAYPKHSTSNAFLELVYNCQHTLLFFSCFHTCWCIFARFWW